MKWPTVFIKDIARIHYGKALKAGARVESGNVPVFGSSGQVGMHEKPLVDFPTLIIGRKGSVGKVTFSELKSWPIDTTFYTEFIEEKIVDLRYFFYALKQSNLDRWTITTSIPGLNRDDLYATKIPLPPIAEQRRIAAILDKADAVRRKRKEAIALTEELLRSAFLNMFGDPVINPNSKELPTDWRKLNVDSIKANEKWSCVGGPFGSNLTSQDYVEKPGIPVIRGSNLSVEEFYLSEDDFVYVSDEKANSLTQNLAYPGDVIFTQRGTLGQVGLISMKSQFQRYLVSQSQMKLKPNLDLVDPIWLVAYFQAPIAQRILENSILATGVPHINLGILKNFPVNLPPLALQRKFAALAKKNLLSQAVKRQAFDHCEIFFNSLLQRAFRGDL